MELEQFRDDIPAGLPEVLGRMLAKAPAERFQTPAAVSLALLPFTRSRSAPPKAGARLSDRTPLPGCLSSRGFKTTLQGARPIAEPTQHPAADTAYPAME